MNSKKLVLLLPLLWVTVAQGRITEDIAESKTEPSQLCNRIGVDLISALYSFYGIFYEAGVPGKVYSVNLWLGYGSITVYNSETRDLYSAGFEARLYALSKLQRGFFVGLPVRLAWVTGGKPDEFSPGAGLSLGALGEVGHVFSDVEAGVIVQFGPTEYGTKDLGMGPFLAWRLGISF